MTLKVKSIDKKLLEKVHKEIIVLHFYLLKLVWKLKFRYWRYFWWNL